MVGSEGSHVAALDKITASIMEQIEVEDSDAEAIKDLLLVKLQSGDNRTALYESLIEIVKVKSTKSDKMLRLLDSLVKARKSEGPQVSVNVMFKGMSPEDKKDLIRSL